MLKDIYENKQVLITGVAGFIGSHLAEYLISHGASIIGIDNFSLGSEKNIKNILNHSKFTFLNKDITSEYENILVRLKNFKIDEVWHLAANSDISNGVFNSDIDLKNTFLTTHYTLKLSSELNIKNFIFASSSAIYGDKGNTEIYEDMGPLLPISNYGAMKLASEAIISSAIESYLYKAWIFRFPNVVGSRITHGIIYDFIKKIQTDHNSLNVLGDGNQCKQYLHVSELIDAMLFIRLNSLNSLNYYNIGVSETSTYVHEIVEMIIKSLNLRPNIIYSGGQKGWIGDIPKFKFSTAKLNNLGWKSKMSSNEAVQKAIHEVINEMGLKC